MDLVTEYGLRDELDDGVFTLLNVLSVDVKKQLMMRFVSNFMEHYNEQANISEGDAFKKVVAADIIEKLLLSNDFFEMQQYDSGMRQTILDIIVWSSGAKFGVELERDYVLRNFLLYLGTESEIREAFYSKKSSLSKENLENFLLVGEGDSWQDNLFVDSDKFLHSMFSIASDTNLYNQFCANYRDKYIAACESDGSICRLFAEGRAFSTPDIEWRVIYLIENARRIYLSEQASLQRTAGLGEATPILSQSRDVLFSAPRGNAESHSPRSDIDTQVYRRECSKH